MDMPSPWHRQLSNSPPIPRGSVTPRYTGAAIALHWLTAILVAANQLLGISMVGLPISLEGGETPSSTSARKLASDLARRTALPVELADERFSTAIALDAVRDMGGSTRGRKGEVDALAATVLLQQYLDERRDRPA